MLAMWCRAGIFVFVITGETLHNTLELLRRVLMCFTAPMFEYGYMCVMGDKVLRNMTQTGLSLVLLPLASS